MACVFITGTDTGVGKTFTTGLVLKALLSNKLNVAVIKPIETGGGEDCEFYWKLFQGKVSREDISFYRFAPALAPAVAAEIECQEILKEELCKKILVQSKKTKLCLVEGAGGILVPISFDYNFADLASDLQMSVIVVVGSKLGCLNHAALTFEVLRKRNISIIGYVLNDFEAQTLSEVKSHTAQSTNRQALAKIAKSYNICEIGYLPFIADLDIKLDVKSITTAIFEHFGELNGEYSRYF